MSATETKSAKTKYEPTDAQKIEIVEGVTQGETYMDLGEKLFGVRTSGAYDACQRVAVAHFGGLDEVKAARLAGRAAKRESAPALADTPPAPVEEVKRSSRRGPRKIEDVSEIDGALAESTKETEEETAKIQAAAADVKPDPKPAPSKRASRAKKA